jgi:hypothetical protein
MSILSTVVAQVAHPVALVAGVAVGQVPVVAKYLAAKIAAAKAKVGAAEAVAVADVKAEVKKV